MPDPTLYFEDFDTGQVMTSSTYTMTEEEIIAFAKEYDPQVFHTDPTAAKETFFGQHVASGWHTAAITMRLMAEAGRHVAGGMIGMGVDSVRWPRPTVPGDTLRVKIVVCNKRASKSQPDRGVVTIEVITLNQKGEVAQEMMTHIWVPVRASSH